jgi:hypothetical protein
MINIFLKYPVILDLYYLKMSRDFKTKKWGINLF